MGESVVLIASGDLRPSANLKCWPAQQKMEEQVMAAVRAERGNSSRPPGRIHRQPEAGHGDLSFHRSASSPLIVAEAVWQYSHHVLPGLYTHRGQILTVANWSGEGALGRHV